jgi:subtilisin family serine protease
VGPLDGVIDLLSGHGTFICGLVHQHCPDADILSWRVVPSEGYIAEGDWLRALDQLAELSRLHAAGRSKQALDVLNLSMGYYHETPQDAVLVDPKVQESLRILAESGTAVVCSAGNDATARPLYPAAFAPWSRQEVPDGVPVLAVGALNPSHDSVALFSNTGTWVSTYAPGAGLLSTMPPLQGGLLPRARTKAFGLPREDIDPDNFTRKLAVGGFGLWSGTSFAAPVVAGRVAQAILDQFLGGSGAEPSSAVDRGRKAVASALEHGT